MASSKPPPPRPSPRARPAAPKRGFPTQQMFILALCRICEPISFTSIFPYIYQMIESFGIAKNENEIGVYAGMVTSAFALAEFSTGMLWGRISDRVGRKPVLIMGLVGTLVSMLVFGFATSFPVALIARALGGGLNGNIGVIQTTVAELVREKEYQPRAFVVMPFIWCLGSIIGPALGGLLANPTRFYPGIFPPGGILDDYPFLLPNMVASIVLVLGILNGILFLEETHETLRHRRDMGREFGQKVLDFVKFRMDEKKTDVRSGYTSPVAEESDRLLGASDTTSETYGSSSNSEVEIESIKPPRPPPAVRAFTRPVVGLIISYGILAYHSMGFEQLMPVFLATPRATEPPHHLIKFTGGLGMNTQSIGVILSMQGVFSMLNQFFVYPPLARYFGVLNLYCFCMFSYPLSYIMVPYINFLPENLQIYGVYVVLATKIVYGVIAYPSNAILLTNSAPSLLVLGAINGVAASAASFARAFSPTFTGIVYGRGLDIGVIGLAWWVNAGVCVIGGIQLFAMMWPEDFEGNIDELEEDIDEEAVGTIAVKSQVAVQTVPIGSGEEVLNEYGLAIQSVEAERASVRSGRSYLERHPVEVMKRTDEGRL